MPASKWIVLFWPLLLWCSGCGWSNWTDCNLPDVQSHEVDHDGDHYVECDSWQGDSKAIIGGGDCDDDNVQVYPGQIEQCNGIDDNCDLVIDEGFDIGDYFRDTDKDVVQA